METLLLISDNHLSFPLFSGGFSFFLFPFFLLSTTTRKGQQKNPPRERERFSFFFFLVGYMCVRALCFSGLAEPSVVESSDDTIESFDCYVKKHKHTHNTCIFKTQRLAHTVVDDVYETQINLNKYCFFFTV